MLYCINIMLFMCEHASRFPPEKLLKQIPDLKPSLPASVDLEWYLRICISSKFPGDADAPGLEPLICISGFQAWLQSRNT